MWDPNDPYGPNGLYTVQRERDAQLKQQEAATEAAARRQVANAQHELNKSLFGENNANIIDSNRSWWSW